MSYRYETHMHTCQGSACGVTPGHEYISRYIDQGYDGIIITDHYFRGNCAVPRDLPWRERVLRFCSGYEDARNEGEKRGFPVFFGWEENFEGDEYLIYGPDPEWLLEHPEMEHWTRKEQYEAIHAAGGCVVQAHPFRVRGYIVSIHLSSALVDGIEVVNTANRPHENAQAMRYAARLGLPMTAGSDNHRADTMSKANLGGIELEKPLTCIGDLVSTILERRPIGLYLPEPVPPFQAGLELERPAALYGADDEVITRDVVSWLCGK